MHYIQINCFLRIFYGCNFNFEGAIFSLMENPQGSGFSFEVKQQQPNLNIKQKINNIILKIFVKIPSFNNQKVRPQKERDQRHLMFYLISFHMYL